MGRVGLLLGLDGRVYGGQAMSTSSVKQELCLCELCGCNAEAQYGHLCAYCDGAHPEYHINDCLECEGEL